MWDTSKIEEYFKKFCSMYGLQEEDLGRTFRSKSKTFKIAGINPRSRQYPIIIQDVDTEKQFGIDKHHPDLLSIIPKERQMPQFKFGGKKDE